MQKKLLVVGGAGYIGSHMVKMLLAAGYDVVTFDNLSTGYRDAVMGGEFVEADLSNRDQLDSVFCNNKFDGVLHFASFIQVGESIQDPGKYYVNNVVNTLNLLDVMVRHDVKSIIFSSTAAIFGEPQYVPINESHNKAPINPYGASKLMVEQILGDYDRAYGLKSVCLRYFNAAGADPGSQLGERHNPETHLIPLVLQAAAGRLPHIAVFGQDYDTQDGTCIRDYIHVNDLCQAHLLAMEYLWGENKSMAFNLGNGQGYTVQQVIEAARQVTGKNIPVIYRERRAGDPVSLVADSRLARHMLGWKPVFSDLMQIISDAWQWEMRSSAEHPRGNEAV